MWLVQVCEQKSVIDSPSNQLKKCEWARVPTEQCVADGCRGRVASAWFSVRERYPTDITLHLSFLSFSTVV